jgi:hypothetical protein
LISSCFGPGLGIIGLEGGCLSDYGDLVGTYIQLIHDQAKAGSTWEEHVLPFCSWGSNIFACVRCEFGFQILIFEDFRLWPKAYNLQRFFELWMEGADILAFDSTFEEHIIEFTNPFTGRKQTKITRRRCS